MMLLRGWRWMSLVSTQREEAISILAKEAKFLVQLGPKAPEHAKQIGKLIVAYQRLIAAMKEGRASQGAMDGTDSPAHH
ncbi:hypothetical protein [Devosia sp. LjRoot3]|uniref:hypothetical protein n=1 Tax=Devosia sp. LjRoot3 TaxID=3342319 RepID=UPI003F50BC09